MTSCKQQAHKQRSHLFKPQSTWEQEWELQLKNNLRCISVSKTRDRSPSTKDTNLASSIIKYTDLGILWKMRTIAETEARRCGKNHINNTSISMGNHTNTRQTPLHQTSSL